MKDIFFRFEGIPEITFELFSENCLLQHFLTAFKDLKLGGRWHQWAYLTTNGTSPVAPMIYLTPQISELEDSLCLEEPSVMINTMLITLSYIVYHYHLVEKSDSPIKT